MSGASEFLENAILNHIFGHTAYAQPTGLYLALFAEDPTDANTGTEASGFGYARQQIVTASTLLSTITHTNQITFTPAGGTWGTISHFAVFDALTNGNQLFNDAFSAPKPTVDGTPIIIEAGTLIFGAA